MNNFDWYAPTHIVFGRGTESEVSSLLKSSKCNRVLLHYGSGSVIRTGLLDKIKSSLDKAGIDYVELGGVVANPRLSLVYEGIELAKSKGVDFILAVGGGSVIDSAKAIAYGAVADFDVWNLYDRKGTPESALPVGVVLTIAAAGSEMSNSSVITNEDGGIKRGYSNNMVRPKFAILNPELTMTLPDFQTACGCTDIIMHTMERYFTSAGNMELTDGIAEALLRTVVKNALILVDEPDNYEARAEVMWAGSLSHNGLTGCGNGGDDFATHRIEHEISGMFDVAHGAGLAAIWGSWARYVLDDCLTRFKKFATNVWNIEDSGDDREVALEGISRTEDFFKNIGMPISLKDFGFELTDEVIDELAEKCEKAVGGKVGAAKVLYRDDFKEIYRMAYDNK
ncbi:iron-containing alcohol dehydrogenase [Mogibacterium neglectum]|uniref:iron-containing alcohol dehydrogenase n=1 Tax=Mogibacterium neglectum TaxID=114528 RepID=UPI00272B60D3|nr:iron-containing alcohol dehydrogenase [Mogibacterium neglectum]WLD76742.1 iron-containing alcohol dehydrogenase [Mogibacterium neglectum]